MEKKDIDVSIIIPAHNEEAYITRCIEALQKQHFQGSTEIIVVDNASSDNTARVAQAAGAIVVHEARKGVCFARQKGAEVARGRILVSTDADSTTTPDWLSHIAAMFAENPQVVGVTGPFQFEPKPWWSVWYSRGLFFITRTLFRLFHTVVYSPACNFAFLAETWREIGGYRTHLTQGGDEYDLLLRLRKKGKIVFLGNNIVYTSSRRLKQGLLYNIFVTLGIYYFAGFALSKVFGKSVIGSYPSYREEEVARSHVWFKSVLVVLGLFVVWHICTFMSGHIHPAHFLLAHL